MRKSKIIFIIVFSILLSVLSIGITSFYDRVRENAADTSNVNPNDYDIDTMKYHLEVFMLAMSQATDEEYQLLQNDILSEEEKQFFQNEWNAQVNGIEKSIYNDPYFAFSITNTKTGETRENHMDLLNRNNDKYCLYQHIKFNENGEMTNDSDINYWFDNTLLYDLFGSDVVGSYTDNDDDVIYIELDRLQLNQPKNLDITFMIPQRLSDDAGVISSTFYKIPEYQSFTCISLLIGIVILGLFILLYPIRIVQEINPFSTIKEWKIEIFIILFSGLIALGITGSVIIVNMTLTNNILNILEKYQIGQPHVVEMIINFGIWAATFFVITCALFIIKYILIYGLWKYIKEKTLLGNAFYYIKNTLLNISEIDLSNSLNKIIMKYIIVNTGVIIVLTALGGFGSFLAIIYGFAAFFFIKNKMKEIQNDYNKLLKLTNELSNGNFEEEIDEDLGIFNSLKNEFNTIKIGFEKAVREETKSQNMKTELISNVSHDLKTPITCIKNYVYLLKEENLDQETRKQYLHSLEQYTNRLTTLIEDLFEVSKVNSGNIQLNLMNLNIVDLLEQSIAESEEILSSKNLHVVKKYDDVNVQLYLDGDKTYRVFENLLTNIGKYALANSRVYIDIKNYKDKVVMEFKNISEHQMNFTADEIVERFVRGDKSRHEMGSGLGLAIAKSFIEAQNGKFDINIDGDLFKIIIVFYRS